MTARSGLASWMSEATSLAVVAERMLASGYWD